MGFSRQEYQSGLPFPPPVDHILSELSTIIHPSWVAIQGMAHGFIEWDFAIGFASRVFISLATITETPCYSDHLTRS